MKETNNVFPEVSTLLSAAEGQRPRNYLSCCSCWIFRLVYALSSPTTVLPQFLIKLFFITISLTLSIYHYFYLSINQYSIAADPGAGIGLVYSVIWSLR